MQWFNMSDVESQDGAIVEKVEREREQTWAETNVAGFPKGKGWRRSERMKPRSEEDITQDIVASDQDTATADQAGTAAEGDTRAEEEGQEAVSPGVKELTRVMSAVLRELTPKKKRRMAGRRRK